MKLISRQQADQAFNRSQMVEIQNVPGLMKTAFSTA